MTVPHFFACLVQSWTLSRYSFVLVAVHNQDRPTAAVTPIQAQSQTCLIPAAVIIPHHSVASQQLQSQLPNTAAYVTAVNVNRSAIPLACAAASLNSPSVAASSLEGDLSGRTVNTHPVAPASPESSLAAGGSAAVSKTDKDVKVRRESDHSLECSCFLHARFLEISVFFLPLLNCSAVRWTRLKLKLRQPFCDYSCRQAHSWPFKNTGI